MTLEPVERLEVYAPSVSVTQPPYLEFPLRETRDVRSGRVSNGRGSTVAMTSESPPRGRLVAR